MIFPCCNDTITVYRKENGKVRRFVVRHSLYSHEDYAAFDNLGKHLSGRCLLLLPGGKYIPRLEDRIYPGIGPKNVDWETFIPNNVRGLGELSYVTTIYLSGKIHHYEAGRE